VSRRYAAHAIVSSAPATIIVVIPAAVATFSPAAAVGITTISARVAFCTALQSFLFSAPVKICFSPIASRILTAGAAPAFMIRFAFGTLEIRAAFGVSHRPARAAYKEKRQYQFFSHMHALMKWTFASKRLARCNAANRSRHHACRRYLRTTALLYYGGQRSLSGS